jgi:hypothetical protein
MIKLKNKKSAKETGSVSSRNHFTVFINCDSYPEKIISTIISKKYFIQIISN